MRTGCLYTITLGNYSDKYLCVASAYKLSHLKRIRLPKTKIDSIRLPIDIYISEFAISATPKKI